MLVIFLQTKVVKMPPFAHTMFTKQLTSTTRLQYTRTGVEQAMKNWEGKKKLQLPPHYSSLPPPPHLLGAHALFCSPVEAMHAVTIMRLKAIGLQLSVDIVLTSRQIR